MQTALEAQSAAGPQPLTVRPLSRWIGAQIDGVDLSRPLDVQTVAAIRQIWLDYGIVLFRGQDFGEDDQVRFAGYFGPVAQRVVNKHEGFSGANPGLMFISNIRENGKLIGALPDGEMMFHSDQCYLETPCMASMLYAMEIPSRGGNTLFANMYRAYDTLPGSLKAELQGARAVNAYDYSNNPTQRARISDGLHAVHPVVRTHPETGRKALYVNRLMTQKIVGMDDAQSDQLLGRLFDHLENPEWIYEHAWRPGDLLMWDNRCTAHARQDFDASERRLLRRCVVLGDQPYE